MRPQKANPAYKGKWTAPKIANPDYIGEWAPRKIANPAYFEDSHPHNLPAIVRAPYCECVCGAVVIWLDVLCLRVLR